MNKFTMGYIEALFWTEETYPEFEGKEIDLGMLSTEAKDKIEHDCKSFIDRCIEKEIFLQDSPLAGHDFWLTRNGHGTGFWAGDWNQPLGEVLTTLSHEFKETSLYLGDDGLLYLC